ncbi:MAG: hypothetical protein K6T78_03370 [Alicyclobacillus sp.]|nr:hypothetical protein [Alicyclobacillus sp.]
MSEPAADREWLRRACNRLAERHVVKDIVPDTARFVFLLESPHVQELKYGAPVSGSSGASMSRHLFGDAYGRLPLGVMVKKNAEEQLHRPSLDRVGLMNVCNIPMQRTAYTDPDLVREQADVLSLLESLRTYTGGNRVSGAAAVLQNVLLDSLRRRLRRLWDRNLYIVPCGRFAQRFFALAETVSPNWRVMEGVPHPSYNNWSKPQYAPAVAALVEAFKRERPQTVPEGPTP